MEHELLRREAEQELGESWLYWINKHPPASCPAFLGRRKANRRPTSGCAVTSEAGLGPVAIWAGGQPQVRQERVALAQWLQLLTLTQRGPCAVLGAQRGLRRCWAGTHTHTHRERHTIRGCAAALQGRRTRPSRVPIATQWSPLLRSCEEPTDHIPTLNMQLRLKV